MARNLRIDELENYGDSKKRIPQYMNPGRAKYIRQIHGPGGIFGCLLGGKDVIWSDFGTNGNL